MGIAEGGLATTCRACGFTLAMDARFCKQCGASVAPAAEAVVEGPISTGACSCGATLAPEAKFCKACGKAVHATAVEATPEAQSGPRCATCGSALSLDAKFCRACGAGIKAPAESSRANSGANMAPGSSGEPPMPTDRAPIEPSIAQSSASANFAPQAAPQSPGFSPSALSQAAARAPTETPAKPTASNAIGLLVGGGAVVAVIVLAGAWFYMREQARQGAVGTTANAQQALPVPVQATAESVATPPPIAAPAAPAAPAAVMPASPSAVSQNAAPATPAPDAPASGPLVSEADIASITAPVIEHRSSADGTSIAPKSKTSDGSSGSSGPSGSSGSSGSSGPSTNVPEGAPPPRVATTGSPVAALLSRAEEQLKLGQYDRAIGTAEGVFALDPGNRAATQFIANVKKIQHDKLQNETQLE